MRRFDVFTIWVIAAFAYAIGSFVGYVLGSR